MPDEDERAFCSVVGVLANNHGGAVSFLSKHDGYDVAAGNGTEIQTHNGLANMVNPYNYLPPYLLSGMALIGAYCLILAYEKKHEIEKVLTKGTRTRGTVVEMRADPAGKEGDAPVVEFNTPNGSHRHVSGTYAYPSPYTVGQEVDIWYKFYKSSRLAALADDRPGKLPAILFRWGVALCLLSFPEIIRRVFTLF